MTKGFDHGGIGKVIGWYINRLDGRHRRARDGCDSLLQLGDFGRKRRLIPDPRRQPPEHSGHLRSRLYEAEHIVHQQ